MWKSVRDRMKKFITFNIKVQIQIDIYIYTSIIIIIIYLILKAKNSFSNFWSIVLSLEYKSLQPGLLKVHDELFTRVLIGFFPPWYGV